MNASANPVLVGGEEVAPGEVALTLETGGGAAESEPDALPYGGYLVREVEAPEGYLGTDAEVPFSIEEDGEVDLCQDFGHASSRNQAAIGMASGLGSVLSKKAAMASAGTL